MRLLFIGSILLLAASPSEAKRFEKTHSLAVKSPQGRKTIYFRKTADGYQVGQRTWWRRIRWAASEGGRRVELAEGMSLLVEKDKLSLGGYSVDIVERSGASLVRIRDAAGLTVDRLRVYDRHDLVIGAASVRIASDFRIGTLSTRTLALVVSRKVRNAQLWRAKTELTLALTGQKRSFKNSAPCSGVGCALSLR